MQNEKKTLIFSVILFTNNLFAQTDSLKFDVKYGWFLSSNQSGTFQAMVLYCGLLKIDNSLTIKEKNQAFDYMMNWWFYDNANDKDNIPNTTAFFS